MEDIDEVYGEFMNDMPDLGIELGKKCLSSL
jgi:hypothetical protein